MSLRERVLGVVALAVFAMTLVATAVPGVFTVDEDNYLVNVVALRAGRLSVPGTEGLPPSRELLYFDPALDERGELTSPAVSNAPPLYAPLALPFSFLGWYGLVALNALALALTAGAAFSLTAGVVRSRRAAYVAALTVALGGYAIEYAQGVWPQMLSMGLVFGAFFCAARGEALGAPPPLLALGGFLAGLACGVRYPDTLFAAAILAGLLAFSARRLRSSLAFAAGLALPILASTLLNRARLGLANPINKGGGYLKPGEAYDSRVLDALRCAVARVIDFGAQAPLQGHAAKMHFYMRRSAETGEYLISTAVKKAWLQSMPWAALALVVLVLSFKSRPGSGEAGDLPSRPGSQDRARAFSLRLFALGTLALLCAVAVSGSSRVDGYCFNQRYLIDLLPLVAVALAIAFDELPWAPRSLAAGAGCAVLLLWVTFSRDPHDLLRLYTVAKLPLALALVLVGAFALKRHVVAARTACAALAASLVWACGVHIEDDLPASRALRTFNAARLDRALAAVQPPAAVFAYWGGKDALGPLSLGRDVVVLDTWPDGGEDAPRLRDALLRQGRHVYVALPVPDDVATSLAGQHAVRTMGPSSVLVEVLP
jgi:hypothetical protein